MNILNIKDIFDDEEGYDGLLNRDSIFPQLDFAGNNSSMMSPPPSEHSEDMVVRLVDVDHNSPETVDEDFITLVKLDPYEPPEHDYPPEQPEDFTVENYPGDYNFRVEIDPNAAATSSFLFSPLTNRIYTGNAEFSLIFGVDDYPPEERLFVRATPTYCDDKEFMKRVTVCPRHARSVVDREPGWENVFRAVKNPEARYFGDGREDGRLSVVFPMARPAKSVRNMKRFFHFVCLTSCEEGMTRRPINLVFSLEDAQGNVLGRKFFPVKISKNSKRDMQNEEGRLTAAEPTGRRKRRRRNGQAASTSVSDYQEWVDKIPSLLPDDQMFKRILQFVFDMASSRILSQDDEPDRFLIECCNKMRAAISYLE